jgi:hypothetical protein
MLAELLTASLLGDLITQAPRSFPLGIALGICIAQPLVCVDKEGDDAHNWNPAR